MQIPLRLSLQQLYKLDNYYFTQTELEQVITNFCTLDKIDFLYLWNNESSGKTHLLLAMADHIQKSAKRVLYLPLYELVADASPEVLESVENLEALCIDDLDAVEGKQDWEEALFHCFNRLQHTGCKLLIASKHNPAMAAIELPDLRSRLATGLVYQVNVLNDTQKHHMLMLQAQSRGLKMPEQVAHYLLRHHSRDTEELMVALNQLDSASMVEQRRLTIPFVRQTLTNG